MGFAPLRLAVLPNMSKLVLVVRKTCTTRFVPLYLSCRPQHLSIIANHRWLHMSPIQRRSKIDHYLGVFKSILWGLTSGSSTNFTQDICPA